MKRNLVLGHVITIYTFVYTCIYVYRSIGTLTLARVTRSSHTSHKRMDISHSWENGVFSGPNNGRKSGNAQNKKHCSLANGCALHNTSGGTPFSCCTCPNTAHKIRTIQTLHTKRFSNPGWWPENTR